MLSVFGQEGATMIPRGVMALDVQRRFDALDSDTDGRLSAGELGPNRWMHSMDTDFDGHVSKRELESWFTIAAAAARLPNANPEATYPFFGSDADPRVRAPRVVAGRPLGVRSIMAPAVTLTRCSDGTEVSLESLCGDPGTVIALVSPSCPVSRRQIPALCRLEEAYAPRGIRFVFVAASAADSDEDLSRCGFQGGACRDGSGALLRALGARTTNEVFLFDAQRTLIYRGAVDDQYGIGYNLDAPRRTFLRDALEAHLAGRRPAVEATESVACEVEIPAFAPPVPVAWHNRVSRILQAHCSECHTAGGSAPFPLDTPDQVKARARTIIRVLEDGVMPPWFSVSEPSGRPSPWINDRSMPEADRADLIAWLNSADRPDGEPGDAPAPHPPLPEWAFGTPDLVLELPEEIEVKAEGTMPWVNVILDPGIAEDRWVSALEVQPTARSVVHHVLVFVRPPDGQGLPSFGQFSGDEIEGFLAGYAPGTLPAIYPEGFAKFLPAGSKLRFQIHYTPDGTPARDRTRLGIRFAASPPRHRVETMPVANVAFAIPPGHPSYPVNAFISITSDIRILSLTPHMHIRGKAFRFDAVLPDGRERTLVSIPRYDYNWQVPSAWAEPPLLPAGSKLRTTAWFDNSTSNPRNPDPAATVRWGQRTEDEMMLGYLEYYRERPPVQSASDSADDEVATR